jgi:hypothetical protein
MKREAKFQTMFSHWLKNVYKKTACFELKQTQTDSLPFSDVKPHQIDALEQVERGTFVFKIPDAGYQNPFDCFCMTIQPAYIVIRYPTFFCLITTTWWRLEMATSKQRSLTAKRAMEIAHLVVPL